jgi:hypothetical protein
MPQRVAITGAWAISTLVMAGLAATIDEWIILPWFYICIVLLGLLMIAAISERDEPGARVARQVPRSPLLRVLVFPFFTGAANGLLWCCAMVALTLAVLIAGQGLSLWSLRALEEDIMLGGAIVTQMLCYSLAAHNLHRRLSPGEARRRPAWIIACAMIAAGSMTSVLLDILAFGGANPGAGLQPWQVLSPFALGNEAVRAALVFLGLPIAVILVLMARPVLWRQVSAFKPP